MQQLRLIWWLSLAILLFTATILNAQTQFKYSYMPKEVYKNQLFPITIMAIGDKGTDKTYFTFDDSIESNLLFQEPLIVRNGNDSFYTFYFKASISDIRIPRLFISSVDMEISLNPHFISVKSLKEKKNFSHLLSSQMRIKSSQVSYFDENNYIVTISIEAYEANLEDMHIAQIYESGIENIVRKNAKVEGDFFVVLPTSQKELNFNYFNTIKNQYLSFKIPIKIVDASISTQSNLNPKDDNFEKLKKYTLIFIFTIFLIMFILKKDFFYLILVTIIFITFFSLYTPHKRVCVKQGSALYILPTTTSTISTRVDEKLDKILLGKHEKFYKIEYRDGVIGWIKNEDICKI